ncbi:MAG: AAA family ATPase [Clostridia bacterium]|nr:AAA family ATPase [Clostridia bacterium]
MATGIMIMGSSGAGKTTLGELVAKELGYTFVDIDEYIWRKDTEIPFSLMYSKAEKISRLMDAISNCEHFVMAGSMDSFHESFDPFFELVVHLHADAQIRIKRVDKRELDLFGARILEGGDMYEEHQKFLNDIAGYDLGIGGCTLQQHETWMKSLKCKVIQLDGAHALEKNLKIIIEAYKGTCKICGST